MAGAGIPFAAPPAPAAGPMPGGPRVIPLDNDLLRNLINALCASMVNTNQTVAQVALNMNTGFAQMADRVQQAAAGAAGGRDHDDAGFRH